MNNIWLVKLKDVEGLINSERIIDYCKISEDYFFKLRKQIAKSKQAPIITCGECSKELIISRYKGSYYLRHKPSTDNSHITMCSHYSKTNPLFDIQNKDISNNRVYVRLLLAQMLSFDPTVQNKTIEIGVKIYDKNKTKWRKPDVKFMIANKNYAIDIINNWNNPSELNKKHAFYSENNIRVIWLVLEEQLSTSNMTFGDIMFGLSSKRNVISINNETIIENLKKKLCQFNIQYPINEKRVIKIKKDKITLSQLIFSEDNHAFVKDCESTKYLDLRSFILKKSLNGYLLTKDKAGTNELNSAQKALIELINVSDNIIFNKGVLISRKETIEGIPFTEELSNRAINKVSYNLKLIEAIENKNEITNEDIYKIEEFKNCKLIYLHLLKKNLINLNKLESDSNNPQIETLKKTKFSVSIPNLVILVRLAKESKRPLNQAIYEHYYQDVIDRAIKLNAIRFPLDGDLSLLDKVRLIFKINNQNGTAYDGNQLTINIDEFTMALSTLKPKTKYAKDLIMAVRADLTQN